MLNPQGEDMLVDWNGYYALSEELSDRGDAGSKRTSVSRAYYAALNLTRQFLAKRFHFEIDRTRDKTHTQVISELRRRVDDTPYHFLPDRLHKLKKYREMCDYDDQPAYPLDSLVKRALELRDEVIGGLKALEKEPQQL